MVGRVAPYRAPSLLTGLYGRFFRVVVGPHRRTGRPCRGLALVLWHVGVDFLGPAFDAADHVADLAVTLLEQELLQGGGAAAGPSVDHELFVLEMLKLVQAGLELGHGDPVVVLKLADIKLMRVADVHQHGLAAGVDA